MYRDFFANYLKAQAKNQLCKLPVHLELSGFNDPSRIVTQLKHVQPAEIIIIEIDGEFGIGDAYVVHLSTNEIVHLERIIFINGLIKREIDVTGCGVGIKAGDLCRFCGIIKRSVVNNITVDEER